MSKSLPARPSLEYLKKEAKDLLDAFRRGDPSALPVVRHLRYLNVIPEAELLVPGRVPLSLQQLQGALAMEYRFQNWNDLVAAVEGRVEAACTDVEQFARFGNREVQVFMRDLDDGVIATVAGAGSPALRERLLGNVTADARRRLETHPAFRTADAGELEAARTGMLALANLLIARGEIGRPEAVHQDTQDPEVARQTALREARERYLKIAGPVPVSRRELADLAGVYGGLAAACRWAGLVALPTLADEFLDEEPLGWGMRRVADGVDLGAVVSEMEAEARERLADYDRRQQLVIAGVLRLSAGYDAAGMQATLEALPAAICGGESLPTEAVLSAPSAAPDAVDAALQGEPISRRGTAGLIPLFVGMAARASAGGLVALDGVAARIDDDLLRTGLQPVVDGTDTEFVASMLAARRKALLARRATRLELAVCAIRWVGEGWNPRLVMERCRAVL